MSVVEFNQSTQEKCLKTCCFHGLYILRSKLVSRGHHPAIRPSDAPPSSILAKKESRFWRKPTKQILFVNKLWNFQQDPLHPTKQKRDKCDWKLCTSRNYLTHWAKITFWFGSLSLRSEWPKRKPRSSSFRGPYGNLLLSESGQNQKVIRCLQKYSSFLFYRNKPCY